MMRRVVVLGCGGSGKTTLAVKLGRSTGLPTIHLDELFWNPGWVPTPKDEFVARQAEEAARDRWIIEGDYAGSLEIRAARADTVIFLDLPRRICLVRVILRRLRRRDGAGPAPGCPQKVDLEFLRWIWHWRRDRRPIALTKLKEHASGARQVVLTTPREVEAFLREQNGQAGR
ncbi:DNA topology modulation protein FlaR [Amycolatopsis sp. NPDC059657]|uniref:DNA topology modulation protein FlaR n=1 Tax=Amycolatopsis sp. NPDC059657 TaxID=3346899 RepID=UPI00366F0026